MLGCHPVTKASCQYCRHAVTWQCFSAEIARVATRLLVLVDALDKTVANEDAMAAAGLEFQNLLEQVPPPPPESPIRFQQASL